MSRDGMANFFLGLGIGVGLASFSHPKSGEETRDTLLNKADEGKEYPEKQASDLRENASEVLSACGQGCRRDQSPERYSEGCDCGRQTGLS